MNPILVDEIRAKPLLIHYRQSLEQLREALVPLSLRFQQLYLLCQLLSLGIKLLYLLLTSSYVIPLKA